MAPLRMFMHTKDNTRVTHGVGLVNQIVNGVGTTMSLTKAETTIVNDIFCSLEAGLWLRHGDFDDDPGHSYNVILLTNEGR